MHRAKHSPYSQCETFENAHLKHSLYYTDYEIGNHRTS